MSTEREIRQTFRSAAQLSAHRPVHVPGKQCLPLYGGVISSCNKKQKVGKKMPADVLIRTLENTLTHSRHPHSSVWKLCGCVRCIT